MPDDRPPVPPDPAAIDRRWRIWTATAVGTFIFVSVGLGFLVVPESDKPGLSPFAVICRSIGIPGYGRGVAAPGGRDANVPGSKVTWGGEMLHLLATANVQKGASTATDVCAACHGENGIAVDPNFPNLANQPAPALLKQLEDFKNGNRKSGQAEIMIPMAQALEPQQMADVAAYYASRQPPDRIVAASGVPSAIADLVTEGDPARSIPPCDSCHGASRSGPEGTPALLGQPITYLEQQLSAFATRSRNNDLFERMRTIAYQLTPDEMHQLAVYYAGVPRTNQN